MNMNEATLKRLRERASSDFDIRDALAEIERLTKAERKPIAEVDPTGGRDPNFNWGGDP